MAKEAYVGRAGQLATMAEYLLRGYNVAIPEVDEGDDVLVISNQVQNVSRVQVKTAIGVERNYGFSGQFQVSLAQIEGVSTTPYYFVFVLRCGERWEFVPVPRDVLYHEHREFGAGSEVDGMKVFYLAFRKTELICSGRDWQRYRNNWSPWPIIQS